MNDITVKKILNSYKHEKFLMSSLNKEIEKFEDNNLQSEKTIKIKNLQAKLNKSNEFVKFIEGTIDNLPQPYKNIFYFRYVKNLSYEKIAFNMNYSIQRIYQLHKEGLNKILEKIKLEKFINENTLE